MASFLNPAARVRADAAIWILRPRRLRGTLKLAHALEVFGVRTNGLVALELARPPAGSLKHCSMPVRRMSRQLTPGSGSFGAHCAGTRG